MGYGRAATKSQLRSKPVPGFAMPLPSGGRASWVGPRGGSDFGRTGQGWFVDNPAAACEAIEFLKRKDLGRGTFIPQQLDGRLGIRYLTSGGLRWRPSPVWSDVRLI